MILIVSNESRIPNKLKDANYTLLSIEKFFEEVFLKQTIELYEINNIYFNLEILTKNLYCILHKNSEFKDKIHFYKFADQILEEKFEIYEGVTIYPTTVKTNLLVTKDPRIPPGIKNSNYEIWNRDKFIEEAASINGISIDGCIFYNIDSLDKVMYDVLKKNSTIPIHYYKFDDQNMPLNFIVDEGISNYKFEKDEKNNFINNFENLLIIGSPEFREKYMEDNYKENFNDIEFYAIANKKQTQNNPNKIDCFLYFDSLVYGTDYKYITSVQQHVYDSSKFILGCNHVSGSWFNHKIKEKIKPENIIIEPRYSLSDGEKNLLGILELTISKSPIITNTMVFPSTAKK